MREAIMLILLGAFFIGLAACARMESERATTNQNAERPVFYAF